MDLAPAPSNRDSLAATQLDNSNLKPRRLRSGTLATQNVVATVKRNVFRGSRKRKFGA
jgi:hypothetical protein